MLGTSDGILRSCSGSVRRTELLHLTSLLFLLATSVLAQTAVYENFKSGIRNSNDGSPLYFPYMYAPSGACPNQTGGIENGMWKEQTLDCKGTNHLYWYVDRIGSNWTDHASGFFRDYMMPGQVWNPSFNRLSFRWRCDYSFGFYAGGSIQYGTFIKDPNDGDPYHDESNNWHFYHQLAANQKPFRWIYATLSAKAQHQRSITSSETEPVNPTTMPNYYDYMVDSYLDFQPDASQNFGTCHFDDFTFSTVNGEPDYYVSSLTGQYTGSHYEVAWQSPIESVLTFEVRYSASGSMKSNGFSSGVDGGTVTTRGDGYTGVLWASPSTPMASGYYVGIRPHMLVQGVTPGAATALNIAGHGINAGDSLNCQNMTGVTPSSWTANVVNVVDWKNVTLSVSTSGTYQGGGWCRTTNDQRGFTEVYIPPDPTSAPMAPISAAVASVTATSITLSFQPDPAATGTIIERSLVGSQSWTVVGTTAALSFTDSGLTPATTYQYRLSGSNAAGVSGPTLLFPTATTNPVAGAPQIQDTTLIAGTLGFNYTAQLRATGVGPFSWSVQGGSLPSGLTLSASGLLSGTPSEITTVSGKSFLVSARDANGLSVSKQVFVPINATFPVTDAFQYPDGALTSSNWENINNSELLVISSKRVRSWGSILAAAANTIGWYDNDQWAQARLSVLPSDSGKAGVGVRLLPGSMPWGCVANATQVCISESTLSGSGQTEVCTTASVHAGDIIRAEAVGTTLTCKLNGSPIASAPITATGGAPGLYTYSGSALLDSYASAPMGVAGSLVAVTASLPAAMVGKPYAQMLSATNGTPPYSWSLAGGSLPAGLSLASSGSIAGTPLGTGIASFTLQVRDAAQAIATTSLFIAVSPALSVATVSLPAATVGTVYSQALTAVGGVPPYVWVVSSGPLPSGLLLTPSGSITGTPTAVGVASFSLQVGDSAQGTATVSLSITVAPSITVTPPLSVATVSLPAGTVGSAYSQTLLAANGTPPYTWVVSGGSLLAGLTLASSGVIYGTPTAIGQSSVTIQVTDAVRATASGTFSIVAGAPAGGDPVAWYAVGGTWSYREQITIDHTRVPGSLVNFPTLVSLSDANLRSKARSDGGDILFTASDGLSKLNAEITSYVSSTGQLTAWVNIPSLSAAADTVVYMYYGGPSVSSQQTVARVWDSSYRGVWHLENGTAVDSTGNGNNGTILAETAGLGKIGGAGSFSGTAKILLGGIPLSTTNTIEGWFYSSATVGADRGLWGNSVGYLQGVEYNAYPGFNRLYIYVNSIGYASMKTYSGNAWHHIVVSTSAGTSTLYVDGVADGLVVKGTLGYTLNLLGSTLYGGWIGLLDEVRVSDGIARSNVWVATAFANQNAPASFMSIGPEQTASLTTVPVSITVTSTPPALSLTVDGAACMSPCSIKWSPGSSHTIAAPSSPQPGPTGVQYIFANWSDSGAVSHSVTAPATAASYTATFSTQYLLTTTASPSLAGSISPPSGWYNAGTPISVSATANAGYQFSVFSGSLSASTSPQPLTLNAPSSVTASFTAVPVSITVASTPPTLSLTVDGAACMSPCSIKWSPGSSHTIAAPSSPQPGPTGVQYIFANWSDSGAVSHSVTAPATAASYTATFSTQYLLTTTASPSLAGSISPPSGWYNTGTPISVSATANAGYQFSVFSGSLSASTSPQPLTLNAPSSVTASFTAVLVSITVASTPPALSLTVDGAACMSPCSIKWSPGSSHTIAAPSSPQPGPTGVQYIFANWSDSGAVSHSVTAPATAASYTTTFSTQYLLTTTASPSLAGSISPPSGWYNAGTPISVSATANAGYRFSVFSGSLSASTSPQPLTLNAPSSVTASFTAVPVSITVASTPPALSLTVDGAACMSPCSIKWSPGSSHIIAAPSSPQPGPTGVQYIFANWSDSGAVSHSVTAPATAASYTATFSTQYLLTTTASPSLAGSISPPSGWYNAGTPISVSATANAGYQFSVFSGSLSASTSPQSLAMNAPAAVTANFITASAGSSASGWYAVGGTWSYREQITIDHTRVPGSLVNFPTLVSLSDANLRSKARSDGGDILFTASDGLSKLNAEITSYVSSTGQLTAWVNIPSLSAAADTVVYMYYGGPSVSSQQTVARVWDSNYRGVWHLENGTAVDSTGNGNNGTILAETAGLGKIGGAGSFSGTAKILLGGVPLSTTNTIEGWFYSSATVGADRGLWGNSVGYSQGVEYNAYPGFNRLYIYVNSIGYASMKTYSGNAWHHIVVSTSAGTSTLYVDGVADGLVVKGTLGYTLNLLGSTLYGGWIGLLDEVRVSDGIARSNVWVATAFANQNAPASFMSIGPEQSKSVGGWLPSAPTDSR